jgi:hypothetical protein
LSETAPAPVEIAPPELAPARRADAWWQRWGNAAQIAAAVVSLLGFTAILFQIGEIRSNNRTAGARQVYLAYTDIAFKNPQFSSPDYSRIRESSRDEKVSYENFVSYFLYACEEVTAAFANRAEWKNTCDYDLKLHLSFLCERHAAEPHYLDTYAASTRAWVLSSMQQNKITAPDCGLRKT